MVDKIIRAPLSVIGLDYGPKDSGEYDVCLALFFVFRFFPAGGGFGLFFGRPRELILSYLREEWIDNTGADIWNNVRVLPLPMKKVRITPPLSR